MRSHSRCPEEDIRVRERAGGELYGPPSAPYRAAVLMLRRSVVPYTRADTGREARHLPTPPGASVGTCTPCAARTRPGGWRRFRDTGTHVGQPGLAHAALPVEAPVSSSGRHCPICPAAFVQCWPHGHCGGAHWQKVAPQRISLTSLAFRWIGQPADTVGRSAPPCNAARRW
jgi:hypothetical protein